VAATFSIAIVQPIGGALEASTESSERGWHEQDGTLRFWDGDQWTTSYAPLPQQQKTPVEETVAYALWTLAFGAGVAGCAAFAVPAIAYWWPLSLGAGGLLVALVAFLKWAKRPAFALLAAAACIGSIAIGIANLGNLEDARSEISEAKEELRYGY
jgi:hypothetical protein